MSGKWSEDEGGDMDDEYEYDSDDDGGYTYESDTDGDGDYEMKTAGKRGDAFTVYNLSDIAERQKHVASELSDVLALPPWQCSVILRHYKWNPQTVKDIWFDGGEAGIREKCGLSVVHEEPMTPMDAGATVECPACLDDVPVSNARALGCGHLFCDSCWSDHLSIRLDEGVSCVYSRCMDDCTEAIPDAWFSELLDAERAEKYKRFVLYSFVEHNAYVRWCSSPSCGRAVEYPPGGMRDIDCQCGHRFCFNCGFEPHRPAKCEHVRKWLDKNSAESQNVTWIIANTKNCPSCRNPIEKNQGCNHMTCRQAAGGCGHEFCWLCLGPWSDHGSATGGFYKCNKFEKDKAEGKTKATERNVYAARTALDRYIHFFDRYINHDRARKIAIRQLPDIERTQTELQSACNYKLSDVTFIREAADQVIKCRQVLKWSYVHGYYLRDDTERNLFEHLQEMLEKYTEHLHGLVETPLTAYLKPGGRPKKPFFDHRSDVTNYTGITKRFLEEILVGVECGLTTGAGAGASA